MLLAAGYVALTATNISSTRILEWKEFAVLLCASLLPPRLLLNTNLLAPRTPPSSLPQSMAAARHIQAAGQDDLQAPARGPHSMQSVHSATSAVGSDRGGGRSGGDDGGGGGGGGGGSQRRRLGSAPSWGRGGRSGGRRGRGGWAAALGEGAEEVEGEGIPSAGYGPRDCEWPPRPPAGRQAGGWPRRAAARLAPQGAAVAEGAGDGWVPRPVAEGAEDAGGSGGSGGWVPRPVAEGSEDAGGGGGSGGWVPQLSGSSGPRNGPIARRVGSILCRGGGGKGDLCDLGTPTPTATDGAEHPDPAKGGSQPASRAGSSTGGSRPGSRGFLLGASGQWRLARDIVGLNTSSRKRWV